MILKYKERLTEFFKKYSIKVLADFKQLPVKKNDYFSSPIDKDLVRYNTDFHTETILTIDIPMGRLELLSDIEATFFNNQHDVSPRRIFETLMEQRAYERRIREKHPAVEHAYQHYCTMLNLCRDGSTPTHTVDLDDKS